MNDYKTNYGITIPQSFISYAICGVPVSVHFEYKKKWDEFYDLVGKHGYLSQCELGGNRIDVWVRGNWKEFGFNPKSLQEHFNDYCKPMEFGFDTFTIKFKKD